MMSSGCHRDARNGLDTKGSHRSGILAGSQACPSHQDTNYKSAQALITACEVGELWQIVPRSWAWFLQISSCLWWSLIRTSTRHPLSSLCVTSLLPSVSFIVFLNLKMVILCARTKDSSINSSISLQNPIILGYFDALAVVCRSNFTSSDMEIHIEGLGRGSSSYLSINLSPHDWHLSSSSLFSLGGLTSSRNIFYLLSLKA